MPSPVKNFTNTPPGSPANGDRYVCGTSPTGAWSGQANKYATYLTSAWEFRTPIEGELVYDQNGDVHRLYDGSAWNLFTVLINSTKDSVRVASTANLTLSAPGSSIDGVSLSSGDRVLVKDQSTGSQNGIYVWNGAASAMTRATDFDTSAEVQPNVVIGVQEGTANADKRFQLTTNAAITLGTTALTFTEFGGSSSANATSIQGVSVSATSPTNGQVLAYNGTVWIPTSASGGTTQFQQDGSDISNRSKANLLTQNGLRLVVTDDSGNSAAKLSVVDLSWKPTIFTLLTSGALTGRNTGSGLTPTDVDTGLYLNFTPGTTGVIRGYEANVSGSRCEVWMRRLFFTAGFGGGFARAFAYARSSGGAFRTIGINASGNLVVESWSSDTTYVGAVGTTINAVEFSRIGVRFSGFSGTMSAEWSLDGQVWITLASGISFTPTTCGVGFWPADTVDAIFHSLAFA